MKKLYLGALLALIACSPAAAWWDTQVRAQKPLPLVKAFPATELAGAREMRADAQANGGRGGQVAYVKPGGSLTFSMDLKRSVYAVWTVARADEKEFNPPKEEKREVELPGGKVTLDYPRQAAYVSLKVKQPNGTEEQWYMPVTYHTSYSVVSALYFPLHVDGKCEITVGLDPRSEIGLLINRLEVRDTLGNCARVPAKTKRMLTTDEELAAIRKQAAEEAAKRPPRRGAAPAGPRTPEDRLKRNHQLWESVPGINLVSADPRFRAWSQILNANGPMLGGASRYQNLADADAAWDAAVLLCAYAERYPAIDHFYSETGAYSNLGTVGVVRFGARMGDGL